MPIFKIIVVRQVTERVWVEILDVETPEAAIAAYQEGEGREVHQQHLSTDAAHIEEVYRAAAGGYTNGAPGG